MPGTDSTQETAHATLKSTAAPRRQARGQQKRDHLVRACADVILTGGPTAVTHRAVATRAEISLAATTYYFQSLDDMIAAAGVLLVADWVRNADDVVAQARAMREGGNNARARVDASTRAEMLVRAVLPAGDDAVVRGHYEHLVGAGRSRSLAAGYAQARADFDEVVGQLLTVLDLTDFAPATVVALVDGAAIAALSEGRPVRPHARALLTTLIRPSR